jgi:hypothetical protein
MWWGRQLFYFEPSAHSYYIPYLSHYYIDSIPFNQEALIHDVRVQLVLDTPKKMNFIFMASNCSSEIRNILFSMLEEKDPYRSSDVSMKKVRSYGSCMNNTGREHELDNERNQCLNRHGLVTNAHWSILPCIYAESKFAFAIENTLSPGYITEKIMIAFQSGAVPIYYGPPEIKTYFNDASFYYINDRLRDPYNPTLEEVQAISDELWQLSEDNGPNGWQKFLRVPIFRNDTIPDIFLYKTSAWMETIVYHLKIGYEQQLQQLRGSPINKMDINLTSEGKKKRCSKHKCKNKKRRTVKRL